MNPETVSLSSAAPLGYMKSGRARGAYSPFWIVSAEWLDAPVAGVNRHQVQRIGVLLVVGEAEVGHAAGVGGHALDEHVVVLGRLVLLAALALLTVDLLGEVVERARIGAGPVQADIDIRERLAGLGVVAELGVVGDCVVTPQLRELIDREAADRHLGVGDDDDAVVRNLDLRVGDVVLRADVCLLGLDRPRSVGDVDLVHTELLEAAAGAGGADSGVEVGVVLLVELHGSLRERLHGAGPVDRHGPAAAAAAPVVIVAAGGCSQGERGGAGERDQKPC